MPAKRISLLIGGRVQGVGYRANAEFTAIKLGLVGYVENLPDGRVHMVAEGEESQCLQLMEWARQGPWLAHVDQVDVSESSATGEFSSFVIRR